MRFLIIGAGDVGTSLCMKLASHGHDVVLVEQDEDQVISELTALDVKVVIGNGANPETLLQAGVHTADYVIAVTNVDETNIASCFVSRLLNPTPKRIARVRDLDLICEHVPTELLSEYFDLIINPDQAGADYLLRLFKLPGAREIIELSYGKVRVLGLSITPQSPLLGKRIDVIHQEEQESPLHIAGYIRNAKLIIPKSDDKLRVGDVIYAVTVPDQTQHLFKLSGRILHQGQTAIIWGGTSLARSIALTLDEESTSVKLILADESEQLEMADQLKTTLVLRGEGTDQNLLLEESIADTDAFIAASPDEESNVLAALLAKKLGARTVMALVNKSTYTSLVSAVGVDVVISSRIAAATAIFRHIHARSLISEISLQSEGAGFIEIDITSAMPISGTPLKDLKLPYGIDVCAVLREGAVLIAKREDSLVEGDRAIFFVLKSALSKLERLLNMKLETFN